MLLAILLVDNESASQSTLLFKSGFESGTYIPNDMLDIHGVGQVSGFDWDRTPSWIKSSRLVYLVNRDKDLKHYMESEKIDAIGPHGNKTRVLHIINKADDPDHGSTSRTEFSYFGQKPPRNYKEGFCRYWRKLAEEVPKRIPFDERSPWYMIMEWKESNSGIRKSAEECKKMGGTEGGSNNYRINIHIRKDENETDFYWQISGQHPQPCRVTEWSYINEDIKVPFGEWFLVEAYMKQHQTDGRVFLR